MLISALCHVISFVVLVTTWFLLPLDHDVVLLFVKIGWFLYCSYLLGTFLNGIAPRFKVSAKGKAVLITGCDSGFGHMLAKRLDATGYKVFACCLSPDGEGALQLKHSTSPLLQILELDVTDNESVQKVLREVTQNLGDRSLWAIVNNAGIIRRGELEWMPLEDYKRQFDVNTFGVVRVTQAFLPLLRKSKGRIITMASLAGRYTLSGQVPYCMSKYATVSFCEGLRMEMAKFDVSVVTIEPFAYKTSMTETADVSHSAEKTWCNAPSKIKDEYGGDQYLEAFKKSLEKFCALSTNSNTYEVVDVMVEAVTCTSPHYSYSVGDLKSVCSIGLVRRLPLFLGNYIVRKFVTFDGDVEQFIKKRKGADDKKRR